MHTHTFHAYEHMQNMCFKLHHIGVAVIGTCTLSIPVQVDETAVEIMSCGCVDLVADGGHDGGEGLGLHYLAAVGEPAHSGFCHKT